MWPADRRPWLAAAIGAAANLGYAAIAALAMTKPITQDSWRWVMLVGAAPALLTFVIRLFVPESERWQRAIATTRTQPVREIFSRELRPRTLLAIGLASVALIGTWGIVQWIPLWADAMTHGAQPLVKARAQFWQAIGATMGSFIAPLLGLRWGRRPVYFGMCVASLLACAVLFRGITEYGGVFLSAVCLTGVCTASFYGWLPQYLPELFPTRVRATGQGLAFNFGRILAAAGVWQMGVIMAMFENSYARAGATISLIYLAGMALILHAPETRGKPLPD